MKKKQQVLFTGINRITLQPFGWKILEDAILECQGHPYPVNRKSRRYKEKRERQWKRQGLI